MAETDDLSLASTVLTEVKDCALDLAGALVNNMTDCWNVTSQMNSTSPKPTLAASSCEYGPGYLRWLSDVVLLPPIVVFGVIGNVMAFATLCAQRGNLSTSILLRFIAVIDTLLLLSAVPMRFMRQIDVCHNILHSFNDTYARLFPFFYGLLFVLRAASTWSTVLLTIDRHIAVCRPLHAHRIVTIKVAISQVVGVAVFSLLFNIPIFFEYHIAMVDGYERVKMRAFAYNEIYVIGYRVITMLIVIYVIPMAILVFFNILLIRNLRVAAKDRKKIQAEASDRGTTRSVTIIVVAVVITFCVCNVMPLTSHAFYSLEKYQGFIYGDESGSSALVQNRRYASNLSNLFVSLNSAVNFLIYCVCCRSFRTTFLTAFCRRKDNKRRAPKSRTSVTSSTYVALNEHNASGKQRAHAHNSLLIESKDTCI